MTRFVERRTTRRSHVAMQPSGPAARLRLLRAVTDDSRVSILDRENNRAGFATCEDAIESGRPFFVKVRENIVALDCDDPGAQGSMDAIEEVLRGWGCRPVVVASGRPGNTHLFVRLDSAPHREYIEAWARADGIDPRPTGDIRPPMTPHRHGLRVSLIEPLDADQAVLALTAAHGTLPDLEVPRAAYLGTTGVPERAQGPWRPLTARMEALLVDGDTVGRYTSPSEVLQALTTAAYVCGWDEEELHLVLMEPANRGGQAYRDRVANKGREYADAWLARGWAAAAQHVSEGDRCLTRAFATLRTAAGAFSGVTGPTDRKVYLALVDTAEGASTLSLLRPSVTSPRTLERPPTRFARL